MNSSVSDSRPILISWHRTPKSTTSTPAGDVWLDSADGRGWKKAGWARIYLIQDGDHPLFDGTFTISTTRYEVKADESTAGDGNLSARKAQMVAYRSFHDSNIDPIPSSKQIECTSHSLDPEGISQRRPRREYLQARESNSINGTGLIRTIGSTDGCSSSRRVAQVVIATDCTYTAGFNSTDTLRRSLINMVNTASEVFENTFNIALALQNLTFSDANCPQSGSDLTLWNTKCSGQDLTGRLAQFADWRASLSEDTNAYWTLMTVCSPLGSELGKSYLSQLCNRRYGANLVAVAPIQWEVFVHETGHTFGAVHDCGVNECAASTADCGRLSSSVCSTEGKYFMNMYSDLAYREFSPCTIGHVCGLLGSGGVDTSCLRDDTSNVSTSSRSSFS
ncbi:ADAM metallopeptidase domain [Aspergillus nanangensis]|uniref:ADAM metallopeptidase domain n=1 Tax=Aspergillus nanangensis TaxID=2582783 RepID=A0AAD4GZN3_ASPNN|nr:ADAM metallopeptidase domain [Aspergillus nanangensis]